jgi:hypothetical protein
MSQSLLLVTVPHYIHISGAGLRRSQQFHLPSCSARWVSHSGLTHIWSRDLDETREAALNIHVLGDVALPLSHSQQQPRAAHKSLHPERRFFHPVAQRVINHLSGRLCTLFCVCEIRIISGAWESESADRVESTIAPRPICYAALFVWCVIMHACEIQRET